MRGFCFLAALVLLSCGGGEEGRIYVVEKKPLVVKVKASGSLVAARSRYINPPKTFRSWSQTIAFLAPEGERVAEGDVLVKFETQQLENRLRQERSRLSSAEKELEKLLLEQESRLEELRLKMAAAKKDEEQLRRKVDRPKFVAKFNETRKLELDLELALRRRNLAELELRSYESSSEELKREKENRVRYYQELTEQLKTDIARLTVTADAPGMVVYQADSEGKKPRIGDDVWLGQTILEIPDLASMLVEAVVPEREAARVSQGQLVEVRLDAAPNRIFRGQITSLGNVFYAKSAEKPSIVFDAVVNLDAPDVDLMRPGMAAAADIIVEQSDAVLFVPLDAVHFKAGSPYVILVGGAERTISLGRRTDEGFEVLSGLEVGEQLRLPTSTDPEEEDKV